MPSSHKSCAARSMKNVSMALFLTVSFTNSVKRKRFLSAAFKVSKNPFTLYGGLETKME